jgi:hypothetical protein
MGNCVEGVVGVKSRPSVYHEHFYFEVQDCQFNKADCRYFYTGIAPSSYYQRGKVLVCLPAMFYHWF